MISSSNNPLVRSAHRLRKAKGRDAERAFLVEGHRAVEVALATGAPLRAIFHTPRATSGRRDLLAGADRAGIPRHEVTPGVMRVLTSATTAPDLIAVAVMRDPTLDWAGFAWGALLAGVRDPATAGSLVACVAATGGTRVAFARGAVDCFDAKTVRAAQGAHFLVSISRRAEAAEAAEAIRAAGIRLIALADEGPAPWEADLCRPFALLVGPEAGPLPPGLEDAADERVAVPGRGVSPSLAARAAAVLYEGLRRRSADGGRDRG